MLKNVAIIDDKVDEVLPLIKLLSNLNSSIRYFDGDFDKSIEEKLESYTLIFSDIDLTEGGVINEMTISTLVGYLKRLLKKNTPYILIFWTKNKNQVEEVLKGLTLFNLFPLITATLDKFDYFESDGDKFELKKSDEETIALIEAELKNSLSDLDYPGIPILNNWRNKVLSGVESVFETINEMVNVKEWNKEIQSLIVNMGKASAGKTFNKLPKENQIKEGLTVFNSLLIDEIETNLNKSIDIPVFDLCDHDISIDQKAKINSALLIGKPRKDFTFPGSVHLNNNLSLKTEYIRECKELSEIFWKKAIFPEIMKENEVLIKVFKSEVAKLIPTDLNLSINILNNLHLKITDFKIELIASNPCFQPTFLKPTGKSTSEMLKEYNKRKNKIQDFDKEKAVNLIAEQYYIKNIKEELLYNKIKFNLTDYIDLVLVEISPSCDYAQNKKVFHKFLYGLKIKYYNNVLLKSLKNEFKYSTPTYNYKGENYNIFFNPKYMHSEFHDSFNKELMNATTYLYTFRKQLVLDLQAQLTHHITRPGILNL